MYNPNQTEIKEIEKIFQINHIGKSRIDGNSMFKIRNENVEMVREFFDVELISLLEDHIPGFMGAPLLIPTFPAGQKDHLILKITGIKKSYTKYIRKEKLKKIEIYL